MPQGVVISVRPIAKMDSSDSDLAYLLPAESYGSSRQEKFLSEMVYIKRTDTHHGPDPSNREERIFWFEDIQGKWCEGTPVTFKINNGKTRQIKEAIDVMKYKSWTPYLQGHLLTKVALLTSFVLLAAVALDSSNRKY